MPESENRPLRVFLCHSSNDKLIVRDLYRSLDVEGWIDAWLDSEKLYPGQDWNFEIEKAVEEADIILVCLTNNSVNKEGYVQRELRIVLDLADYKPEGTLFIIPIRLEECTPPRRLRTWQYADYFPESDRERAYQRLLVSLKMRAMRLGISTVNPTEEQARIEAEKIKQKEAKERASREAEDLAHKKAEEQLRLETEEIKRKQVEDQVRKEKEAQARRAADERARFIKEQQEKQDAELRSQKESEALAAKAKINEAQKVIEEKPKQVRESKPPEKKLNNETPLELQYYWLEKLRAEKTKPFWTTLPGILTVLATLLIIVVILFRNKFPSLPIHQVSNKDGMTLLYVPAGEFTMGSDNGNADEKPVHQVNLDAFWIDLTEVTNSMYAKCVKDGKCDPPSSTKSYTHDNYYGNSQFDNYPVIYVSWDNAKAYCTWADRRLPTEAEWEKAARGTNANVYPWGNNAPNSNLLNYNNVVGDTTAVGKYPNGKSLYGAYDMAGNVWEWVADWYSDTYYIGSPSSNPLGPDSGQDRVLRGGSWNHDYDFVRSADRNGYSPTITDSHFGFRCSRSP